ncbi:MAG: FAD-binding oxidoreductase [Chloroflexi bacterium]|nr:FAD-binding oxidoreductase [Chloroflexota bacterium]
MRAVRKRLSGWGRFPVEEAWVYRPDSLEDVRELLPGGNLTLRGLGRSYGDASLNKDGNVADLTRLDRFLDFDGETGRLTCEGGVSLAEVLEVFVPRGWFLPVTPGTKFVTVAGAIASDVHGKNHHNASSLSRHVESMALLLASGETVLCSRESLPDLFWATAGGMGLTGIIAQATFRLRRIETSFLHYKAVRARDLDHMLETLEQYDPHYDYSVAWIDGLAGGKDLGKGVVLLGSHAPLAELPTQQRRSPLPVLARRRLSVSRPPPFSVVNRMTIRLLNTSYRFTHRPREALVGYDGFFYPLDGVGAWNRLYGSGGFLQHQSVFPLQASRETLVRLLEMVVKSRHASSLVILKKFGPQEGLLSFPMPGYTVAMDFPVYSAPFLALVSAMDELVAQSGGRVYLAKDACLSRERFQAMYPRWKEWLAAKERYDPRGAFTSSMARRLGLAP